MAISKPSVVEIQPTVLPVIAVHRDRDRIVASKTELRESAKEEEEAHFIEAGESLSGTLLYGIAQFKMGKVDAVVEGGIWVRPIFNFCGGCIASSARINVSERDTRIPGWDGALFRMPIIGKREAYEAGRYACTWPAFDKLRDAIPDLNAYSDQPITTKTGAILHMKRSLAAGLLSWATYMRYGAVFCTDTTERGLTMPILQAGEGIDRIWVRLPRILTWDKGVGMWHMAESPTNLRPIKPSFVPMPPYRNPNSGHMVQMGALHTGVTDAYGEVPMYRSTVPIAEIRKFVDTRLTTCIPQGRFFN